MKKAIIYRLGRYMASVSCMVFICCSCENSEVPAWDSDNSAYAEFTSTDTLFSFAGLPDNVTDHTVEIPVTLHLDPAVSGHEIWIDIARQPLNPLTHVECQPRIEIAPGDRSAKLAVNIFRTKNLKEEADEILLRITESPTVKAGRPDYRVCRLVITDFFVKPEWWGEAYDSYYNPVGECNNIKLELWFEVFGNFEDPRHGSRAWTGADAVIALALINEASMTKYGKMFHELLSTDQPLN